jgi:hypothetical protein
VAESVAASSVAAESVVAESVAAESVVAEPVAAESVVAESVAAESVATGLEAVGSDAVTSAQTELDGACPCPAPARAARPVAARADSKTDIASRASTPTASPAADICELTPGPDSLSTRAARQMGHHAHSGASSAGGTVALAHTSAGPPPTPSAERIWSLTSRLTLRAPERTSHRWKSPIGSWPDRLGSCVMSRLLFRLRPDP